MIIDGSTGIELIPGNHGKDCPGNGENGNECCCDECDFLCCCIEYFKRQDCDRCVQWRCPRNPNSLFQILFNKLSEEK